MNNLPAESQDSGQPDLSILIVNWNSASFLRKCLASIYTNTKAVEFEVIVIDNASYDGCGEMLRAEFPTARFIQNEENLGFARANNVAFQHSRGRHVLFLNPDTEVVGAAIEKILRFIDCTPDAGIVGCKLLNSDLTLQTSCIQAFPTILNQVLDAEVLRRMFPRSRLWGMRALFDDSSEIAEVEAVSGACLLIRRAVFDSAGGFNTNYFMYSEDVDLCYQSRRAGWKNYFLGDAVVIHHGGGSTAANAANHSAAVVYHESKHKFFRMHRGAYYAAAYRTAMFAAAIVRLIALGTAVLLAAGAYRREALSQSAAKWRRILRWAMGREARARGLGESAGNQGKERLSSRQA